MNKLFFPNLVIVSGAESSGKTSLSIALAKAMSGHMVSEYARAYLGSLGRAYQYEDLLPIAHHQCGNIFASTLAHAPNWVIADTGLLVMKVWYTYRYDQCPVWIDEHLRHIQPLTYLICEPDLPWESDPLREHPNEREQIHRHYLEFAETFGLPYHVISGSNRLEQALRIIEQSA